jgi:hypothetical protein
MDTSPDKGSGDAAQSGQGSSSSFSRSQGSRGHQTLLTQYTQFEQFGKAALRLQMASVAQSMDKMSVSQAQTNRKSYKQMKIT